MAEYLVQRSERTTYKGFRGCVFTAWLELCNAPTAQTVQPRLGVEAVKTSPHCAHSPSHPSDPMSPSRRTQSPLQLMLNLTGPSLLNFLTLARLEPFCQPSAAIYLFMAGSCSLGLGPAPPWCRIQRQIGRVLGEVGPISLHLHVAAIETRWRDGGSPDTFWEPQAGILRSSAVHW